MGRTARERAAYSERIHRYERTPAWRIRSQRFRVKHGPKCDACSVITTPSNPLHAHHVTYERAFRGREPDRDLRGLCGPCHREVHAIARRGVPLLKATNQVIRAGHRGKQGFWRTLLRLLTGL